MVRPGLINLDFADVETVMTSMGKAMMGTGEAEGEKRAFEAAETALKNPLIDEYSLKGAKGLLINITGGKDLTLFEVDEAVNKVRAEVDPEAELIIGAITDSTMEGKMRVSIVATALDNQGPQTKPVVSMVHRIHNRNSGYNDRIESVLSSNQATIGATDGATALDINVDVQENQMHEKEEAKDNNESLENVSIESATYLQNVENSTITNEDQTNNDYEIPKFEVDSIELATPELFSDSSSLDSSDLNTENKEIEINQESKEPEMFEDKEFEEDFEIPAFLRKQKN